MHFELFHSLRLQRYYLSVSRRKNRHAVMLKNLEKQIAVTEHCLFRTQNRISLKSNLKDYLHSFNNTVGFIQTKTSKSSKSRLTNTGEIYHIDTNTCISLHSPLFCQKNRSHMSMIDRLNFGPTKEIHGEMSDLFYLRMLLEIMKSHLEKNSITRLNV